MALSTARMHKVRGRPPLLAEGISSLIHSHSSSVRSLGYVFSLIFPFYTTNEDFSDRLSAMSLVSHLHQLFNAETCQSSIHTLRWKDRPLQCPRCQSHNVGPWGTYHAQ